MLKQRAGYYSSWVKRVSEYYPNGGNICRANKYSLLENEALIINIKKTNVWHTLSHELQKANIMPKPIKYVMRLVFKQWEQTLPNDTEKGQRNNIW